jgi:hypothetical protein
MDNYKLQFHGTKNSGHKSNAVESDHGCHNGCVNNQWCKLNGASIRRNCRLKKEINRDRHREKEVQQQKVEDDVSTLTQYMHKMVSGIIDIRKDMNGISTQMKEITDLLKTQFNMKQAETKMITSPPRKR